MAIKKNQQKETKETRNNFFTPNNLKDIANQGVELKDGKGMRFTLCDGLSLTIMGMGDNAEDIAFLNVGDFSIFATVRSYEKNGTKKWFLSLPSYKKKNGDYFEYVRMFNKDLHNTISQLLEDYYS